jgi:UDP-GlcNAc:undecaprenyl-phosphate GlcNAc-1-phosphate transferase
MYLLYLILLLCGIITAVIIIPAAIRIANQKKMLVKPNSRSAHMLATPSMGGVSFIPGVLMAAVVGGFTMDVLLLTTACMGVALIGFLDDLTDLRASIKLVGQLLVASIIFAAGIQLNNLVGFLGMHELPWIIGFLLTLLVVVGITNAFNLVDGADGLAGGVGLVCTLVFGVIFLMQDDHKFAAFAFAFAGSLAGFLHFNFRPAKIFMGDTGSLLLGLLMAVFFIRTFSYGETRPILVALGLILMPCVDMLRLFIFRILAGKSPFKADKNHYHHLLGRLGFSPDRVLVICCIMTFFFMIEACWLSSKFGLTYSIIIMVGSGSIMYGALHIMSSYLTRKRQKSHFAEEQ